jgi:hypothetical protein
MTQEEKDLLLKGLCGRLPYGVKVKFYDHWVDEYEIIPLTAKLLSDTVYIGDIKPYLLPLSSMTKEQKEELENLGWHFDNFEIHNVNECLGTYKEYVAHLDCFALIDWLNKNHFDFRGLIEKGLANDATGLGIYENR